MRIHFDGLTSGWTRPKRPVLLGERCLAVVAVLGIIFGLLYAMLNLEPSFAKGAAELNWTHPSANVVFISASTNDPPRTLDPGYDKDVASCTAKVWRGTSVLISVRNGYPNYTCTFSATVYNSGALPVCLESVEFQVPSALTVTGQKGLAGLVLKPGQRAVQVFSIRIKQEAKQAARYSFRISELFRAAGTGGSGPCGRRASP